MQFIGTSLKLELSEIAYSDVNKIVERHNAKVSNPRLLKRFLDKRFEVLRAVPMNVAVVYDVPLCSLVDRDKVSNEFAASMFRRDEYVN